MLGGNPGAAMRDTMKRLERLEATTKPREPLRIVLQIIRADNGRALPWDPQQARGDGGATIYRSEGETVEAFTGRALDHFRSLRVVIGGRA
jgi:hypothetical protein